MPPPVGPDDAHELAYPRTKAQVFDAETLSRIAEAHVRELDRRSAGLRDRLSDAGRSLHRKSHEFVDPISGGLDGLAHGDEVEDSPHRLVQARQVGEERHEVADRRTTVDDLERAIAEDEAAHDVLDGRPEAEPKEIVVRDHSGLVTPVAARPSLPPGHLAALTGERLDGLDVVEYFRDVRLAGREYVRLLVEQPTLAASGYPGEQIRGRKRKQCDEPELPVERKHDPGGREDENRVIHRLHNGLGYKDLADAAAAPREDRHDMP